MDGGKLVGFDDFHKAQSEADPSAFINDAPLPQFAQGAQNPTSVPMNRERFLKLGYGEQLKFKQQNPDIYNTIMKG